MPVSKAQQKATNKWIAKTYDRINLTVPKGRQAEIKAHAENRGESVNGFIGRAITETMDRDQGGEPQQRPIEAQNLNAGEMSVSLPSDVLDVAQRAAECEREDLSDFVARAITEQAGRDALNRIPKEDRDIAGLMELRRMKQRDNEQYEASERGRMPQLGENEGSAINE